MSQLEYYRDVDYPSRIDSYNRRINLLQKFSAESQENARIAKEEFFSLQNALKAFTGYLGGLQDKSEMARKASQEEQMRSTFKQQNSSASNPWDEIAKAMKIQKDMYLPLTYVERLRGFNSELARLARDLVRVTAEKTKPNGERLREYRDSSLPSLEQELFSSAPIYKSLEAVTFSDSLGQMQQALGPDNQTVKKILNGKTADEVGKEAIANTKLDDVAVRKQLYEGGSAAIQASNDPLIVLMRTIDPDARAVRKQYDDEVDAVERRDGASIAKIRFAQSGFNQPPDATFTLRLSYGAVKGYVDNGKKVPYFTDFAGGFQHAAEHDNKDPYHLPDSWMNAKAKLNLRTPLNFVTTADIIGGNSGSPTVNTKGEVVGIVFDGNIESLVWNFFYTDAIARAVHVDSRGIEEALRRIYGASELADELAGKAAAGKVVKKDGKRAEAKKVATPD
jgi:hypothetical protein